MLNYNLKTPFPLTNPPLNEYPRPQLVRDSYMNLNGIWNFEVNKEGTIPDVFQDSILVPYPPESVLSGKRRYIKKNEFLIYSKIFDVEESFLKDITLLHIDAIDQVCDLYFNGEKIMHKEGGYLPLITELKGIHKGKNRIDVVVRDENSYLYPYGKQRLKRGGIWYTHVSGIWQSVWMESVSSDYIKNIKVTLDIDKKTVHFEIESDAKNFEFSLLDKGNVILKKTVGHSFFIPMENGIYWSPENPYLYTFILKTENDMVTSYFAYRKCSLMGKHFLLNNKPYFINGLLDQGYFSDGIYTPSSYLAYQYDIKTMKEYGFNALRKHIKIEPMRFYYLCDTLGMLVLQDMVNVGKYSFLKDTVLAFMGKKKLPYILVGKEEKESFKRHSIDIVRYLYNVPSVIYYTIFNEGWGQWDGDFMYDILHKEDPSRIYDSTSGWYRQKKSDVASYHIYFKPLRIKKEDKPVILSEFGGYSFKDRNHSFNTKKTFGYKKFKTAEEFEDAFIKLYENEVLPLKNELIGVIYTQVSDVEDETNGILTYDRRSCKLDKEKILPVMKKLIK